MSGGLFYPTQTNFAIIGSKSGNTRTSVALTSAYQEESGTNPTKTFRIGGQSKVNLDILYTTGAGETNNTIEIKLEASPDGVNMYQLTNESASSGTSTLYQREFTFTGAAAATAYAFTLGIDVFYEYLKVSAKESGVATSAGTVYIEATLSGR